MKKLVCPLRLDEDAQQVWREVVAEMKRRGVKLLSTDSVCAALVLYCRAHANWSFLVRWLAEHGSPSAWQAFPGLVSKEGLAYVKKGAQESWKRANELAAIFSLSPADRIRIHKIPGALIPRGRRPGGSAGRRGARA